MNTTYLVEYTLPGEAARRCVVVAFCRLAVYELMADKFGPTAGVRGIEAINSVDTAYVVTMEFSS